MSLETADPIESAAAAGLRYVNDDQIAQANLRTLTQHDVETLTRLLADIRSA